MAFTVEALLNAYRKGKMTSNPQKIQFQNVGAKDVYNITAPIEMGEDTYILGRVESRDTEISEVGFFRKQDSAYVLVEDVPKYSLQDPFITKINNEYIFGGVSLIYAPETGEIASWKTCFYRGTDIRNFQKFFEGPDGMKDLRMVQLADGKIGVFTRPQGKIGGRGKIGFVTVDCLEQLSIEKITQAPLFDFFIEEEWGGVNEIQLLEDGTLGVLGHIAKYTDHYVRHYYAMSFVLDPISSLVTNFKIIAERNDFLNGPAKRPDLQDVIFSGGILLKGSLATLYVGVSDAEAQCIDLPNPFQNSSRE